MDSRVVRVQDQSLLYYTCMCNIQLNMSTDLDFMSGFPWRQPSGINYDISQTSQVHRQLGDEFSNDKRVLLNKKLFPVCLKQRTLQGKKL